VTLVAAMKRDLCSAAICIPTRLPLLGTQILFRGLNRPMPEQELDLLKLPTC
jgi:hypothetical protein